MEVYGILLMIDGWVYIMCCNQVGFWKDYKTMHFESDMTTVEMDIYCAELMEEVSSQKEVVEDNQALILALDDQQTFQTINQVNTDGLKKELHRL